jgi:hypothetical protein
MPEQMDGVDARPRVEDLEGHDLERAQIRMAHLLETDRLPQRESVLGPAG